MRSVVLSLSLLLSLSAIGGCSGETIYPQHPLVDEILFVRPGHPGKLTNRACLEYNGFKCVKASVLEYDLSEAGFRDTINRLQFICNVGGKRYKICKDKPGYCRMSEAKDEDSCFLFWCGTKTVEIDYIPSIDKAKFLLDAKTRCFNKTEYPFGGLSE